jgi:hypothetical protein
MSTGAQFHAPFLTDTLASRPPARSPLGEPGQTRVSPDPHHRARPALIPNRPAQDPSTPCAQPYLSPVPKYPRRRPFARAGWPQGQRREKGLRVSAQFANRRRPHDAPPPVPTASPKRLPSPTVGRGRGWGASRQIPIRSEWLTPKSPYARMAAFQTHSIRFPYVNPSANLLI